MRGYAPNRSQAAGRSFGILRNVYQDKTTGVQVQNIDVDIAKTQLATLLARREPGAGFVHLPCGPNGEVKGGWDEEAIGELTAEYKRETNVRGYTVAHWYKRTGRANHRLDAFCYCLAALVMSRLKLDDCELQRTEARNVEEPASTRGREQRPRQVWGVQPLTIFGTRAEAGWYGESGGGLSGYNVRLLPGDRAASGEGFGALPGSGIDWLDF